MIATRSGHKLRELRELLSLRRTDLVSLDELGITGDPIEDGLTFETNARIKARFAAQATGLPALADDSGSRSMRSTEIQACTRRYAGAGHGPGEQREAARGAERLRPGATWCSVRVRPRLRDALPGWRAAGS